MFLHFKFTELNAKSFPIYSNSVLTIIFKYIDKNLQFIHLINYIIYLFFL